MKSSGRPKPKKMSKRKKKGWKSLDTGDLEDYFDERCFEERTGGVISTKSDSELFFVDKEKYNTTDGEKPNRRNKKLRCYSNLEPDPRIKPVSLGKCTHKKGLKRLHPEMKDRISGKLDEEFQSQIDKYHKSSQNRKSSRIRSQTVPEQNYDIWADIKPVVPKAGEDLISDVKTTKPVKIPKHKKEKPSAHKAIDTPHPGMSYNPAFDDHKKLLNKALKVELKKKKKEEEINKTTVHLNIEVKENKKKVTKVQKNKEEEIEDEEFSDEELESTGINPAVRREDRKTHKQKEHDRKVKLRDRQKNALKSIRIRESEVYRIKTFNKEFKAQETLTQIRQKKKEKLKVTKQFRTKRLGHAKYEAGDIDVQLGKEISGSLRKLKPEGNILSDRYKSFQKRNIIPAPSRIQKRKLGHVKFYEKRGHKEISEQAGFK